LICTIAADSAECGAALHPVLRATCFLPGIKED
jgi:hypothetical protein